jgi:hypothetical protein
MRLSYGLQNNKNQGLMLEATRIGLFFLILLISVVSSVVQSGFINWAILGPFCHSSISFWFALRLARDLGQAANATAVVVCRFCF